MILMSMKNFRHAWSILLCLLVLVSGNLHSSSDSAVPRGSSWVGQSPSPYAPNIVIGTAPASPERSPASDAIPLKDVVTLAKLGGALLAVTYGLYKKYEVEKSRNKWKIMKGNLNRINNRIEVKQKEIARSLKIIHNLMLQKDNFVFKVIDPDQYFTNINQVAVGDDEDVNYFSLIVRRLSDNPGERKYDPR